MTWNHYEENPYATPEELAMSGTEYDHKSGELAEIKKTKELNPFDHQVGGSHYKQYTIQPYEFFFRNNIPHHKAAIIRRILRYDHETGQGLTDLKKIIHEVELIMELLKHGDS